MVAPLATSELLLKKMGSFPLVEDGSSAATSAHVRVDHTAENIDSFIVDDLNGKENEYIVKKIEPLIGSSKKWTILGGAVAVSLVVAGIVIQKLHTK